MTDFAATVRLRAALRKMGVSVVREDRSGQSRSVYLTVERADEEQVTVRISDHELPVTYLYLNGEPEFDVDAECKIWARPGATHWSSAAAAIAAWAGVPCPEGAARVRAKLLRNREMIVSAHDRAAAKEEARQRALRRHNTALLAAAGKGHLTGQARKRALKKLR